MGAPMGMRPLELLGTVRGADLSDANILANYLQSFSKSLLPGFDQLGFLGLLFTHRECCEPICFQGRQICASSLRQVWHAGLLSSVIRLPKHSTSAVRLLAGNL